MAEDVRKIMDLLIGPWKDIAHIELYMIRRNESDVGDVVFEILAKRVVRFLCFISFWH